VPYIADSICELQRQKYSNLLLGGLSEKAGVENLILYSKYIKNHKVEEIFLPIIPLKFRIIFASVLT
jgi:hypothetical protein